MERPDVAQLVQGVLARDERYVAAALSLVEDRRPRSVEQGFELLSGLGARVAQDAGRRVGVTGPPGVGKSSLCQGLVQALRQGGQSVGVLCVDPSSPRSGGALLGDRARMSFDPTDGDVFVRSMASGGHLGGLSRSAGAAVAVLGSAYDVVLVETTGVGQSETDIEHVTDIVVLVVQPASGDMLQFIKAGIMEIPDLFVVNKADLGDVAARAGRELGAALGATVGTRSAPPVLFTSAQTGQGVGELSLQLESQHDALRRQGALVPRRRERAVRWALRLTLLRYGEALVERLGGNAATSARLSAQLDAGDSAALAVERLAREAGWGQAPEG